MVNIPAVDIMGSVKAAFVFVKDIIYRIILYPFKLWFKLPWWVNGIVLILIAFI